jgi:hypothetical protein
VNVCSLGVAPYRDEDDNVAAWVTLKANSPYAYAFILRHGGLGEILH